MGRIIDFTMGTPLRLLTSIIITILIIASIKYLIMGAI